MQFLYFINLDPTSNFNAEYMLVGGGPAPPVSLPPVPVTPQPIPLPDPCCNKLLTDQFDNISYAEEDLRISDEYNT